jgi:hypothetical protein
MIALVDEPVLEVVGEGEVTAVSLGERRLADDRVVITPQCQVLMLVQRRGSRFGVSAGAQQAMLDRNQVRDVVGIGGARATAPSLPEAPTSIWAGLQRG